MTPRPSPTLALVLSLSACGAPDERPAPRDAAADVAPPDDRPPPEDAAPDAPDEGPSPFEYSVTMTDPEGLLTAEREPLLAAARAGLDEWGRYVTGLGTLTVELRVMATMTGRFAAASATNVAVGPCRATPPPCTLVEEQAIRRLRTGLGNPRAPGDVDVVVSVAPGYVRSELWFDPDPSRRTAPVPDRRLDAVSVFTHEFGHALGFVGFRSLDTFRPSVPYQSYYDELVRAGDGALTFHGPTTVALFGPLPLTRTNRSQNVYHYGDPSAPSPFDDGLMNGIVYRYGRRYRVGRVDLAVLADLGVPLRRPP